MIFKIYDMLIAYYRLLNYYRLLDNYRISDYYILLVKNDILWP